MKLQILLLIMIMIGLCFSVTSKPEKEKNAEAMNENIVFNHFMDRIAKILEKHQEILNEHAERLEKAQHEIDIASNYLVNFVSQGQLEKQRMLNNRIEKFLDIEDVKHDLDGS